MTAERIAFVRGVAAVAGLIALVIPFTAAISPIEGMFLAVEIEGDGLFLFVVSAPAFLAIPIALWQIRRIFFGTATNTEVALAYLFSAVAMLPVLVVSYLAFSGGERDSSFLYFSALAVYWVAATLDVGLLVRNRLRRLPPEICAEVFLLLAYVPNSLFALIVFSYWGMVFGPSWMWDVGAYVVLATCVTYVVQASMVIRLAKITSAD